MRIQTLGLVLAAGLLMGLWTVQAQTPAAAPAPAAPVPQGIVQLSDFGPVGTAQEIQAAFEAASAALSKTGGTLCLTPAQSAAITRENTSQASWRKPEAPAPAKQWGTGPGFTIVKTGEKNTTVLPPQIGGLEFKRALRMDSDDSLGHWTTDHLLKLRNDVIHGSNSYLDWLQEAVQKGTDRRFYVKSTRGIRPGQFLNLHGGPGYGGAVTRGYIKSLGYDADKKMPYFVADTENDHVVGAIVHNKNNVGALYLEQNANCDLQTYDIMLRRRQYAGGDTYMFFAWYDYMSDIHSAAGDENGTLYGGYVHSLINVFRAKVDSVAATNSQVRFSSGRNMETLSNSRPLINLNKAKWVTAGKVRIVPAESYWDTIDTGKYPFEGKTHPTRLVKNPRTGVMEIGMGGLIRGDKDCPWNEGLIGRFFAVTEATETVPGDAALYRWYQVTGVTVNPDGTKDMTIRRYWWGAKEAGSPTLYRLENGTWDGHDRPLAYAVAPGAYVNDVSKAVPGDGFKTQPVLGMAPGSDTGTAADFAAGDDIEQAIGPDPFKPIPFRMWMWDQVPGAFPAAVMDLANYGVCRYAGLQVRGGPDSAAELSNTKDQRPAWENAIVIESAAEVGLNCKADFTKAAILFQQPYLEQPVKWYYGFESNQPPKEAVLTVSRESGQLSFNGSARFAGLSADATPARNLRGKNVAVKAGETAVAVAFAAEETDASYAVFVEQNWIGNRAVVKKDTKGFTVQFEKAAPEGASLDWMLVR